MTPVDSVLRKYLNMTREEKTKFMNECINGQRHSDGEIALSLAFLSMKKNGTLSCKAKKTKL